jgi:hypothetical protein
MRTGVSILFLLAACLLIWSSGALHPALLAQRAETGMDAGDPLENTPPVVAFTTVALGGFRGLIVDALWLRATRLQDEGRYFELVQLADWITKLEPRFAPIWAFHAWNMAYNVSVLMDDPADRWRWVRHGIELLRDRGLRYNPGEPQLYRELGWIFQHKMGEMMDQAHLYYKRAWAEEIEACLDGPSPEYDRLENAPTRGEVLANPDAAALVAALRDAGTDPFAPSLVRPDRRPEAARDLLEAHPGARALLDHLRRAYLEDVLKMDPAVMREVDERYGPLDWRLPEAHAIYWAWRGRERAEGFARVNLERMIFQSLSAAFRRGRLTIDPDLDLFIPSPNLDLLPRVQAAYEEAIAQFPDQPSLVTAYANFLKEAMVIAASYNQTGRSRDLYRTLRELAPETPGVERGYEAFLVSEFSQSLERISPREVMALVEGSFVQAYFWRAVGEEERAAGFLRMAGMAWERYMAERDDPEFRERTGLPSLTEIRDRARQVIRERFAGRPRALERLK